MSQSVSGSDGAKDTTPLMRRSGGINSRSSSSSSLPALDESEEEIRARKKSLYIVYLTNFLSAMGFSILLSSMYQYLEDEAGQSAKAFQGYLVGAFSLGQVIGAPFWGGLSIKWNYLTVFVLSISVRMCGNLMYALTHSFNPTTAGTHNSSSHNVTSDLFGPGGGMMYTDDMSMGMGLGGAGEMTKQQRYKEYWMTGARFLTGFGAGSMAVCNAYVAGATTMEERTAAMAAGAASGGLGFIMGPLVAIAFTAGTFNIPDHSVSGDQILLNFETAPAYFSTVLCILNIAALLIWFRETRINEVSSPRRRSSVKAPIKLPSEEEEEEIVVEPFDKFAAIILLAMYFASMIAFSTMETVAVPLLMAEYNFNKRKAAQWCSGIIGAIGVNSVIMFAIAKPLGIRFGERKVLVVGMIILCFAQIGSMPFAGDPVAVRPHHNKSVAAGFSWAGDAGAPASGPSSAFGWQGYYDGLHGSAGSGNFSNVTNTTHNCDMEWCYELPKIPFGQYFFATVFLQSAFPLANVMLFTLYSKVLGPMSQGLWMGLLNSSGSAARMMGPIAIMQLFVAVGPRLMYTMVAAVLALSCTLGICNYSRLQAHIQQRDAPPTYNPAFKNNYSTATAPHITAIKEENESSSA